MNFLKKAVELKPTPDEISEFRKDIETVIKCNVDSMIFRKAYDGINDYLVTFAVHTGIPTYVLEYILKYTYPIKDELPFREVFFNKVEDNARLRDESVDLSLR